MNTLKNSCLVGVLKLIIFSKILKINKNNKLKAQIILYKFV